MIMLAHVSVNYGSDTRSVSSGPGYMERMAQPQTKKNALKIAKFTTLQMRREKLCLKFAKECTRNDKLKDMFPLSFNDHNMDKRNYQKYKVNHAKTERYFQSSIPYLQRLLNKNT